jgi:mycothiol synthase
VTAAAVKLRRLEPGDLPGLEREVGRARVAGEFRASSDPEAAFFTKSLELAPHPVAVALAADGAIVGFVSPEFKVVVVRPEDRRKRIGRRLVDAAVEIERERARPNVLMGVLPDDVAGRAFLEATGFAFHSTLWDMVLPPEQTVPVPVWPAGMTARPFVRDRDGLAFIRLFNAAFATHATPLQIPESDLDIPPDPNFEDADTHLVEDASSGELLGFCATSPERVDGVPGPHAEIWTVGVRPDMQGRGLGRQLLRWGVQRLRSLGVRDVTLSVNHRNEHALALYESEGFARSSTRDRWARPVPEVGS